MLQVNTPYDIRFKVNEEWRELCTKRLTEEQLLQFVDAIEEEYYVSPTRTLFPSSDEFSTVLCCTLLAVVTFCSPMVWWKVQFELFLDDLPIWGYVGEEEVSDFILGTLPYECFCGNIDVEAFL